MSRSPGAGRPGGGDPARKLQWEQRFDAEELERDDPP